MIMIGNTEAASLICTPIQPRTELNLACLVLLHVESHNDPQYGEKFEILDIACGTLTRSQLLDTDWIGKYECIL